jgi:tetratricopeptide (TPR) repeat protein
MKRSDFLKMIESSGPADRQTIGEVSELINIFPYFQSAYSLLLKGLQNTSDVRFENQLRVSAMHIANREVLYYFLKKEVLSEVKTELSVSLTVQTEGSSSYNLQTVIESGKSSADLINEIEKISTGENADDTVRDHSVLISDNFSDDDLDATILMIDEESGDEGEKITYMDPGFSVPEKGDLLELDLNESVSSEIHGEENVSVSPDHEGKPSVKELQSALIDKFIDANPRIEPSREKSDIPVEDISKPFAETGEGLVTETLARIYIRQGYYSKAINIYEKLSLKFPEKSSYFASQIEKVKELIKK